MATRRQTLPLAFLALAAAGMGGCSCSAPSQEEVDDAKDRVNLAVQAVGRVRVALELLGLLPVYECGEPRRTFVGKAVEQAERSIGCVTATAVAEGQSADAVNLAFPEAGCEFQQHSLAGAALFRYSGGEDRLDLEADFGALQVDGDLLPAKAGYGTCSDEKRVWASAEGEFSERAGCRFKVDARVGLRDGMPVIGGTTVVLDGGAEITRPEGLDKLSFTSLHYEIGQIMPKQGSLLVETSGGKRIQVTFDPGLWRLGEAEVVIDDRDPVTIPVVH